GPSFVFFFQPCSANANLAHAPARAELGFEHASRSLRQWLQRPAYNHNHVPAFRMPRHALDRLRIKRWVSHSCLCSSFSISSCFIFRAETDTNVCPATCLVHSHAPQIHFVRVHHLNNPASCQAQRLRQPVRIIPAPNQPPVAQHPKKSLLHRRPRHQRPIQIKKRRNTRVPLLCFLYFLCLLYLLLLHHIALCAILFAPRTCPSPVTWRHP